MKRLVLLIVIAVAILTGCGQQAKPPAPEPELRAGDVYWVCDLNGENCECRAIGAAECPEEVGP